MGEKISGIPFQQRSAQERREGEKFAKECVAKKMHDQYKRDGNHNVTYEQCERKVAEVLEKQNREGR